MGAPKHVDLKPNAKLTFDDHINDKFQYLLSRSVPPTIHKSFVIPHSILGM